MKATVISVEIGALGAVVKGLVNGLEKNRNKNTRENHLNDITFKIDQNTKKSPENLRRFSDIQTPGKYHQLMLVGKALKGVK